MVGGRPGRMRKTAFVQTHCGCERQVEGVPRRIIASAARVKIPQYDSQIISAFRINPAFVKSHTHVDQAPARAITFSDLTDRDYDVLLRPALRGSSLLSSSINVQLPFSLAASDGVLVLLAKARLNKVHACADRPTGPRASPGGDPPRRSRGSLFGAALARATQCVTLLTQEARQSPPPPWIASASRARRRKSHSCNPVDLTPQRPAAAPSLSCSAPSQSGDRRPNSPSTSANPAGCPIPCDTYPSPSLVHLAVGHRLAAWVQAVRESEVVRENVGQRQ